MKNKITISITEDILKQIDDKIDNINLKNRSSVIEKLLRQGLELKQDVGVLILAHDNNWDDLDSRLNIPKVLIKIDGKTLLDKHLEYIKNADIKKVVISVGYMKNEIIDYISKKKYGLEINFLEVDENESSLTVLSKCKKYLDTNKILTILGDNYFYPLDLTDFIYYHNSNKTDLTMIVKNIDYGENYGNICINGNDIVEFNEKPDTKDKLSNIINAGIYMFSSSVIPEVKGNLKIETDFFPQFVKNRKVKAYFHNGKWFHMQDNKTLNLVNN